MRNNADRLNGHHRAIGTNQVRITDHADEEAEADRLTFDEVFFSVFGGEIIEDAQPTDAQRLGV